MFPRCLGYVKNLSSCPQPVESYSQRTRKPPFLLQILCDKLVNKNCSSSDSPYRYPSIFSGSDSHGEQKHDKTSENSYPESNHHVSYPIGSVCMVYMLTWLGYIDGKCYHIYHTWIRHGYWLMNSSPSSDRVPSLSAAFAAEGALRMMRVFTLLRLERDSWCDDIDSI